MLTPRAGAAPHGQPATARGYMPGARMSYNLLYGFKAPRKRGARGPAARTVAPVYAPLCRRPTTMEGCGAWVEHPTVRGPRSQTMPPAGDRPAPGWRRRRSRLRAHRGERWGLPSRPLSTQAEPSRRGPWRPGRSYSGTLHSDAMNHARSTCLWVDGGRDGSRGKWWVEVCAEGARSSVFLRSSCVTYLPSSR